MNLVELLKTFRRMVDDHHGDDEDAFESSDEGLHAKNDETVLWANEAVREYRRRIPISDATTAGICQIAVSSGTADYVYDSRIFHIFRARLESQSGALACKTVGHDMDDGVFAWLSSTDIGTPTHYLLNKDTGQIRLYPIPDADDTLHIGVWRMPLADMTWANRATDTPECPELEQRNLLYWMCKLYYEKQDADTYDPRLRDYYEVQFDRYVGHRLTGKAEQEHLITQNVDMTVRAI